MSVSASLAALADAGLLVVEELAADALLVVHVQELSLLLLDFFKDGLAALDLLLGGRYPSAKVVRDLLADFLAFGRAKAWERRPMSTASR